MKPKWLIQEDIDGIDTQPIVEAIVAQGSQVSISRAKPFLSVEFDTYLPEECVICYGSIDFIRRIKQRTQWVPGVWCNFENMKCSTYYAHYGSFLLNNRYAMLPVGDLLNRWHDWVDADRVIGNRCQFFIRPNSGAKPFTGFVVSYNRLPEIQKLVDSVGPETLVVVAPLRQISEEYRFVIVNRKVVTGCRYLPEESVLYDEGAWDVACKIAEHPWQPDLAYTVDVARHNDTFSLLEVNSFSCSGFYACDIPAIVTNANALAVKE